MDTDGQALPAALVDALASWHAGESDALDLETLCHRHPDFADELRAVHARLVDMDAASATERPERIGPYRIQRLLGRGGMGIVYLAEQDEPVRRQVALKVVRAFDDDRLLARFDQERQALALMNHDGIARVFDSGTTADGRPYFAMEYVQGLPLNRYCEQNRVDLTARIRLVQDICAALTHAHQKGVVHRDLKPDNILVVDNDGRPRIKIIDLGLAKLIGALRNASAATQMGQALGTLQYMAPEQAEFGQADVDTRADIWAMGVILYELLIGRPPWSRQQLQAAGIAGVGQLLRESEHLRPSTGLHAIGADAVAIAAQRGLSAKALRRLLRNDLDWVVRKAMEPDRSRRYETASALAMDLQRFLDHEPLFAGPPSAAYRLRKLVRRHRGPLAATVAVLVTAAVGGVVALDRAIAAEVNLAARQEQILLGEIATLRDQAATLIWPSRGPLPLAALEQWLQAAEALRSQHVDGRAELRELVRRAAAAPTGSSPPTPDFDEAAWLRGTLAAEGSELPDDARLRIEERVRELAEQQEVTRPPQASDPVLLDRWTLLRRRVRELDTLFAGPTALQMLMSERLAAARRIEASSTVAAEQWRAVLAEATTEELPLLSVVQRCVWLWPLGRDPRSRRFEFCALSTGEVPERTGDGSLRLLPSSGLVFVLLPGGRQVVGAQRTESATSDDHIDSYAEQDEGPPRELLLAPFLIGKHEVPQAVWMRLTGTNPAAFAPNRFGLPPEHDWLAGLDPLHPIEQVSHEQCVAFLSVLGMRLPTEAQWEHAARAGTDTPWWTGDDPAALAATANLGDESARAAGMPWGQFEAWIDGAVVTARVDAGVANPFGLHGTMGNVWEWCVDSYAANAAQLPARAADGLVEVHTTARAARSGTYSSPATSVRCANRAKFHPGTILSDTGMRAVILLP